MATDEVELLPELVDCPMCEGCGSVERTAHRGVAEGWQPIETAPQDGTTFRAYSPELVHPDFNPWGSVEAVFDGEKFIGAVWDGQFDCWNTVPITPTLWRPIEDSPSYRKE
jgi:hypothetical protein